MIQRTLIYAAIVLGLLGVCKWAPAAQTPVTAIVPPTSGKWTITDYTNTKVNPKLATIESNRQDHEARVASLEALIGDRPWVAQATAPADTTLLWFDTDQVADAVVLKIHTGGVWVQQAIGSSSTGDDLGNATAADVAALFSGAGDYLKADGTTGTPAGTTYTAGTGISIDAGVVSSTVTDTDTFASWDKDYADLTNKPTIPVVSDVAYDATSWNGNTDAASKNAVRDKIESMSTGSMSWPSSDSNYYGAYNGAWTNISDFFVKVSDEVELPAIIQTFMVATTAAGARTAIGAQAALQFNIIWSTDCASETGTNVGDVCIPYSAE